MALEKYGVSIKRVEDQSMLIKMGRYEEKMGSEFPGSFTAFKKLTMGLEVSEMEEEVKEMPSVEAQSEIELEALDYMPDLEADFNFTKQEIEEA